MNQIVFILLLLLSLVFGVRSPPWLATANQGAFVVAVGRVNHDVVETPLNYSPGNPPMSFSRGVDSSGWTGGWGVGCNVGV